MQHRASSFVTLTYDDEHLPEGGTLVPRDAQLFLKRLRKLVAPMSLRFFLVGEYGEQRERPHYHLALFGMGLEGEALVHKAWGMGFTQTAFLTQQSAQYIAGYVVKKLTDPDDRRLKGRHPEFSRMSRNGIGGIGAGAMQAVAASLNDKHGAELVCELGDVPQSLKHGRQFMPLGRYLRRKLREEMGFDHVGGQAKPKADHIAEMQALRDAAGNRAAYEVLKPFVERQRIVQIETKARIWAKKGKL